MTSALGSVAPSSVLFIAALLLMAAVAAPARAQRNGDVRGGFDNQPSSGEVRSREKAAGVEPPPAEQRRQNGTVDSIYGDLMGKERASGMTNAPADPRAGGRPAAGSAPR